MLKNFFRFVVSAVFVVGIGVTVLAQEEVEPVRSSLFEKASETVDALVFVHKEIAERQKTFINIEEQLSSTSENILKPLELKINTLENQLQTIEENMRRAQINLSAAEQEAKAVRIEVADLKELKELKEIELTRAKQLLEEFMRLSYAETMNYTDWQSGQISALKFLLSEDELADVENQQTYLAVLQNTSAHLIQGLQVKQAAYERVLNDLLVKQGKLVLAQNNLIKQKERLGEMRSAKEKLLEKTKGEEKQYQELIEESLRQQAEALFEIESLRDQMGAINEKLKTIEGALDEEEFREILQRESMVGSSGLYFPGRIPRLIWPIMPNRGITAYFHDSAYRDFFGVTHQAIDIRAAQGSPVVAAAPGVVFKAVDNGFGYSYIAIVHSGGLVTVCGHISEILVKKDDVVRAGDLIGLSGGMPGTRGAGFMTTGAHLHFEVIENEAHHDPLDYLPLEPMRLQDIPERYLKEAVQESESQ